jgi:hypothetical protein
LHKAKERMRECLTLKYRPTQHSRNSRRRLGAMHRESPSMATAASLTRPSFAVRRAVTDSVSRATLRMTLASSNQTLAETAAL